MKTRIKSHSYLSVIGLSGGHNPRITYHGLGLSDFNLDLSKSRDELLLVDLVVSIETVKVAEGSSKSTDSLSTSGLDLGSNLVEN